MAATGLQVNWTGVAQGSNSITKVTSVKFNKKISIASHFGDDSPYAQAKAIKQIDVTASVDTGDESAILAIADSTSATFTATHKDAKHALNGDIIYSLANALPSGMDFSGAHGEFGKATLNLEGASSDGTTSPLSFTRA